MLVQSTGLASWQPLLVKDSPTFFFCVGVDNAVVVELKSVEDPRQRWELLPQATFADLPRKLWATYSHWICDGQVCFLPTSFNTKTVGHFASPVASSPFMYTRRDGLDVIARRDGSAVLATTAHAVTEFCQASLQRIDDACFTHVWWTLPTSELVDLAARATTIRVGRVSAHTERAQLRFSVSATTPSETTPAMLALASDLHPGMAVATDQDVGTLNGLSHGLLLTSGDGRHAAGIDHAAVARRAHPDRARQLHPRRAVDDQHG